MSDITLTITVDEAAIRSYAEGSDPSDADIEAVVAAIIAALPPEPPKEGESWGWQEGDSLVEYQIGPIKWGMALIRRVDNNSPSSISVDYIAKRWTKVR